MIYIVDGVGVGAGKSYFVFRQLLQHWAKGGTAYVSDTMVIYWEKTKAFVAQRYGVELEDDQFRTISNDDLGRCHEMTAGGSDELNVLIVIDEAQGAFNVQDHADKSKRAFFNWLTQSRHDNNDVCMISQHTGNIDTKLKRVATYTYRIENLKEKPIPGIGKLGTFFRFITFGIWDGWFFRADILTGDAKKFLDNDFFLPDIPLMNCYESKACKGSHKRLLGTIPRRKLKAAKRDNKPALYMMGCAILTAAIIAMLYI